MKMKIKLQAEALVKSLLEDETWPDLSDFREVASAIVSSGDEIASDGAYEQFCLRLEAEFGEEVAKIIDKFVGGRVDVVCDWLHYHQRLNRAVEVIKRPDFVSRLRKVT